MNVLVIGATGRTGRLLVKKLLRNGHNVTAMARNPADMNDHDPSVRVVEGEARNPESIERALQGQDAVLSAFGPRSFRIGDLQEAFMHNLVSAMKKQGVKRLVNLSAMGAGDSRKEAPFLFRFVILPLFLGTVFADKNRGEAYLLSSDLDYINVRPGRLLDTPARGGVKASLVGKGLKSDMTREDLADFMVVQLTNNEWVRKSPLIGY
jgi:uncharacterized protein YbjT (DUF2867 family)